MQLTALTTIDNPFDPFEQFVEWYVYDTDHGYDTPGKIARLTVYADFLSDGEVDALEEYAMDQIVANDFMNMYKKVVKDV